MDVLLNILSYKICVGLYPSILYVNTFFKYTLFMIKPKLTNSTVQEGGRFLGGNNSWVVLGSPSTLSTSYV